MKGKLIFLTGFFGAGKTTLMNAAVGAIPTLNFLVTYTTRPQRKGEINGEGEYIFTNEDEYFQRKAQSTNWDEAIVYNFYYGNDVESINKDLLEGKSLIVCTVPDKETIEHQSLMYSTKPILIWIDTGLDIANSRAINEGRPERTAHPTQTLSRREEILKMADAVFIPESDDLEENKRKFIDLVKNYTV